MPNGLHTARAPAIALLCVVVLVSPVLARQVALGGARPAASGPALPRTFDGPAAPVPPDTMVRDAEGKATVRAVRLTAPLRIDGQLDEALYTSVQPVAGLIQTEPRSGAAATEDTEMWIAFDDANVYFSVRVTESNPERAVVKEMRRDSTKIFEGDHIGIAFDTFYDRRNSTMFFFNSIGGRAEGQLSDEANYGGDWNTVWQLSVRRNRGGWTAEVAIPFKSLRYRPGRDQVWGFQVRRNSRAKNEITFLTRVPDGLARQAFFRTSRFATLVGIEAPTGQRALEVKPSLITNVTTDLSVTPQVRNDLGSDVSVDVKYGVTRSLTADLTYNTDFAQVEADEQQVNLTRFSLFFPEKRDFFLENQGTFNFGNIVGSSTDDSPVMFYSRRIGLEQGLALPISGGGRLTGRVGKFSVGFINIETGAADVNGGDLGQRDIPSTNFTVARIRRDILRRSSIGAIATARSTVSSGVGSGETYGVDGTFAFFTNLAINTYWAKTDTPGLAGSDTSYRAHLNYNADRYGLQLEHLLVGPQFNPDVGFLRRTDFRKSRAELRFSPRPRNSKRVRRYWLITSGASFDNAAGVRETRILQGQFSVDFQNSDRLDVIYTDDAENISKPFRIGGVTVPTGRYDLRTIRGAFTFGQQRSATGLVFVERGPFYGGENTTFGFNTARVNFSPKFSVEPGLSISRVILPFGNFTAKLVSSRVTYTITPMIFVSGLLQYNTSGNSLSTNLRLRWEYRPGSELFVVYNDSRDTLQQGWPGLLSRSFIVKANRLLRF